MTLVKLGTPFTFAVLALVDVVKWSSDLSRRLGRCVLGGNNIQQAARSFDRFVAHQPKRPSLRVPRRSSTRCRNGP